MHGIASASSPEIPTCSESGRSSQSVQIARSRCFRRSSLALLAAATSTLLLAEVAGATTISIPSSPSYETANSVPTANIGTSGYEFFNCNNKTTNVTSPVSYVSSITTTGTPYIGATTLTIASTAYTSGLSYVYASNNTSWETLGTISLSTLATSIPAEFQLGIFADNQNIVQNGTDFKVVDTPLVGSAVTSAPTTDVYNGTTANNFYFLDIDDPAPGDTLTILGQRVNSTAGNAALGGFTFDVVPEPASLGLMAGIIGIGMLKRRPRRPRGPTGQDAA